MDEEGGALAGAGAAGVDAAGVKFGELAGDGKAEAEAAEAVGAELAGVIALEKESKTLESSAAVMPMPVSEISMQRRLFSVTDVRTMIPPPAPVNFTAFLRMFQKIC